MWGAWDIAVGFVDNATEKETFHSCEGKVWVRSETLLKYVCLIRGGLDHRNDCELALERPEREALEAVQKHERYIESSTKNRRGYGVVEQSNAVDIWLLHAEGSQLVCASANQPEGLLLPRLDLPATLAGSLMKARLFVSP